MSNLENYGMWCLKVWYGFSYLLRVLNCFVVCSLWWSRDLISVFDFSWLAGIMCFEWRTNCCGALAPSRRSKNWGTNFFFWVSCSKSSRWGILSCIHGWVTCSILYINCESEDHYCTQLCLSLAGCSEVLVCRGLVPSKFGYFQ